MKSIIQDVISARKPEYNHITSAAGRITLPDGRIVILPCHRHSDVLYVLRDLEIPHDKSKIEWGFLDWGRNFLTREEAFIRAKENNQIIKRAEGPLNYQDYELYSEDLW